MPYFPPEVITQAKQMDLLTYLQSYEPQELVHFSGDTYTTRTHDSLKISNGKWMWWSRGIGGKSALDYLVKVKDYTFTEAIETIMGHGAVLPTTVISKPANIPKKLLLPDKSASTNKILSIFTGEESTTPSLKDVCVRVSSLRACRITTLSLLARTARENRSMPHTEPPTIQELWATAQAATSIILFGWQRAIRTVCISLRVPLTCFLLPR